MDRQSAVPSSPTPPVSRPRLCQSGGYRTLKDYRLIIAMYPGRSIDGDESGIGNLLLVAVMYHVLIHQLYKPRGTRISTRKIMFARARTLNMYLNIVRCLSIKLLVHECHGRITVPMSDDARMEMSKFSAARKQSRDTRARAGIADFRGDAR